MTAEKSFKSYRMSSFCTYVLGSPHVYSAYFQVHLQGAIRDVSTFVPVKSVKCLLECSHLKFVFVYLWFCVFCICGFVYFVFFIPHLHQVLGIPSRFLLMKQIYYVLSTNTMTNIVCASNIIL